MKNVFLFQMKSFILFISFLILSLSSLPCCLLENIGENTLCIEPYSDTEDGHSGEEPCSPFFNCGSCAGFTIHQNIEISFNKDELAVSNSSTYQDLFKSAYQNPDFKPPKSLII